jgi:hypothetical protein
VLARFVATMTEVTAAAVEVCFWSSLNAPTMTSPSFSAPDPDYLLQPHGRSILALQGQVGARDAQ